MTERSPQPVHSARIRLPAFRPWLSWRRFETLAQQVEHQFARIFGLCAKQGERGFDKQFFLFIDRHLECVMFTVHPAARQLQPLLDRTRDVVADIFTVAFDMAEITVGQVQSLREQLEHTALRQLGMLADEVIEQLSEIFMSYLRTIHRPVADAARGPTVYPRSADLC
ncbi:MAG: hypothetical protein ACM3WS_07615 [Bacillota bacterium]